MVQVNTAMQATGNLGAWISTPGMGSDAGEGHGIPHGCMPTEFNSLGSDRAGGRATYPHTRQAPWSAPGT